MNPVTVKLQGSFKSFLDTPFDFFDGLSVKLFNRFELNLVKEHDSLRSAIFKMGFISLGFWVFLGWDSTAQQVQVFVENLIPFLSGSITWERLIHLSLDEYGKNLHWSALVGYCFMYYLLSRFYERKLGLTGSRNTCMTSSFVLLSIGVFETFWQVSYYVFQDQPWILAFKFPQLKLQIQYGACIGIGLMFLIGLKFGDGVLHRIPFVKRPISFQTNLPRLSVNWDSSTWILLCWCFVGVFFWWFYPLPVQVIEVETSIGTWVSSRFFPQTLYTVDVDPLDMVFAGVQFYVPDAVLHGVNVLVKIMFTWFFLNLFKLKKHVN